MCNLWLLCPAHHPKEIDVVIYWKVPQFTFSSVSNTLNVQDRRRMVNTHQPMQALKLAKYLFSLHSYSELFLNLMRHKRVKGRGKAFKINSCKSQNKRQNSFLAKFIVFCFYVLFLALRKLWRKTTRRRRIGRKTVKDFRFGHLRQNHHPPSLSHEAFTWIPWMLSLSPDPAPTFTLLPPPSYRSLIMVSFWPQKWQGGLMASREDIHNIAKKVDRVVN